MCWNKKEVNSSYIINKYMETLSTMKERYVDNDASQEVVQKGIHLQLYLWFYRE